jgi:ribonuclease HII
MRIGADEAGKGPVLGPMVAAAVRAAPENFPEGLADSKRLSPERREELDAVLRECDGVRVATAVVSVARIDAPETDMNSLGVEAQAEAIAGVAVDGDEAVVDAADVSEARFGRRVRDSLTEAGLSVSVQAEHGADDTYELVSAASVVAKVERDRLVEELAAEYGDVGSGYPSDPTTRQFLADYVADHGDLPDCARRSWSTCEDLLASAEQSGLDEF